MKPKTTGLGKGLGAIFEIEELNIPKGSAQPRRDSTVAEIDLELIVANPEQPRSLFDQESLAELAQSIERLGVIQPITVKRLDKGSKRGGGTTAEYMIISGERRYRASRMAGLETIPAYVREANDQTLLEMALVENIQREDLGALEVALSLQRLIDECNLTQESLAERVGKKRSTIANYIRLLKLPAQVQGALNSELITMGHARALAGLTKERQQLTILARILKNHLSVRQTEEAVQRLTDGGDVGQSALKKGEAAAQGGAEDMQEYPACYSQLVERLEPIVGSKISIKRVSRKKNGKESISGRITIEFDSDQQVEQMLGRLNRGE